MKKVLAVMGVVLTLSACGGNDPETKTQREAVDSIRDAMGISVSEEQASDLMWAACATLDNASPASVSGQLGVPPIYARTIMNNATQTYCPEHREAVTDYLAD